MTSVLAVDDSAAMRQMVACVLRSAGYGVIEAVDGIDALDKIAAQEIDVVLTDHNMPRMDGLELTRVLRGDARWRHLPILVLTTDCDEPLKQAGRAAGATGWLRKPFDPAGLVRVLQRVSPQAGAR